MTGACSWTPHRAALPQPGSQEEVGLCRSGCPTTGGGEGPISGSEATSTRTGDAREQEEGGGFKTAPKGEVQENVAE